MLMLRTLPSHLAPALLAALCSVATPPQLCAQQSPVAAPRPMTWVDMQNMRQFQAPVPSPDGKWALYSLSTPDWKEARRQSDIYLVSTEQGVPSTRQLTFTNEKNETNPLWTRDGKFFVFLSDRDAPTGAAATAAANRGSSLPTSGPGMQYLPAANGGGSGGAGMQLFLMRPDGGEARRITDARDGVTTCAFSGDGKWLVYRTGSATAEQLYALPVAALVSGASASTMQLTRHPTGVGLWRIAPDSRRIYFAAADTVDPDEKARLEKRFDVRVRNMETPLYSLWALDLDSQRTSRLTRDSTYSVGDLTVSPDGKWIGFHGLSTDRYERNILEQNEFADIYLHNVASGNTERLTTNKEISESGISFSPDSRSVAFSAPDDFIMRHNLRAYVRAVDARGAALRKLGTGFDGPVTIGFWSADASTIYFNVGIKATDQVAALDIATNRVRVVTSDLASLRASQDEDSDRIFISRSDPKTPATIYSVTSLQQLGDRNTWTQLTDANPFTRDLALGAAEEITWRGKDGTPVGGVLVKPVGYQSGTRYPLIVALHGGPQSADVLSFNGGYGSQVYAGAGYAVLMPNYRNSTNYGERFEIESQGDYFTKGYQDIMAGVDHLIRTGLVDSTQMGVLGWSAGGHWSNWILTHTNRFKAISTGAGVYNWISMYGESDTQRVRQWYLGDKMYWDDMQHWWKQSPAAYIQNAKTPTMIHVVDGDPRVPRPESEGLHMALKRLGVPTEFYVYPGGTHGIPDARNQLLKATAEMAWMDYWVRHSGKRFVWRDVLRTLDDARGTRASTTERF
jgi:dipeptidyl aminopeptidase/acylaminoacyl peptidase